MAIISSINGTTRKVYLNPSEAVNGVLTFHPVLDIYANYKTLRATNEEVRPYNAFMRAEGNNPKGGGKYTPRYLLLLEGTKLVIPDDVSRVEITGEVITDEGTDPFDYSLITGPCTINYKPSEAEVIKVTASGNEYSLDEISARVWAELLESGYSIKDILKVMLAVLAGGVTGAGTGIETFKSIDGTVDRVVSEVDEVGNRTSVTLDVS